jgi:hypothetical protein
MQVPVAILTGDNESSIVITPSTVFWGIHLFVQKRVSKKMDTRDDALNVVVMSDKGVHAQTDFILKRIGSIKTVRFYITSLIQCISPLIRAACSLTTMTCLSIGGGHFWIEPNDCEHIARLLLQNGPLESLDFDCRIGDDGASKFANALISNNRLTRLHFRGCEMTSVAASCFGDMLRKNHSLRELWFSDENFGILGVHYIASALKDNTGLQSLRMRECRIGNDGLEELASMLETNETLTELSLLSNAHTYEGIDALISRIDKNRSLTSLDIYPYWESNKKNVITRRNAKLAALRPTACAQILIALLGMRKLRPQEAGLLSQIPRCLMRHVMAHTVWETRSRIDWDKEKVK